VAAALVKTVGVVVWRKTTALDWSEGVVLVETETLVSAAEVWGVTAGNNLGVGGGGGIESTASANVLSTWDLRPWIGGTAVVCTDRLALLSAETVHVGGGERSCVTAVKTTCEVHSLSSY